MSHQSIERFPIPEEIHDELLSMQWLASIFPIKVGSGTYNKITLKCPYCNASIGLDMQKGAVDRSQHSVAISGFGFCSACKSLAPFEVRLREDGSLLFRQDDGWGEQKSPNKGVLSGLLRLIMGGKYEA